MYAPDFPPDAADEEQDVTCKRCGASGLHWGVVWYDDGERCALFSQRGRPHTCQTAASPDEFE